MAAPLADFLQHFGRLRPGQALLAQAMPEPLEAPDDGPSPIDAAFERGHEAARVEAEAQAAARLAEAEAAFADRLAAARAEWTVAEGQALAAGLHAAMEDVEERIAASLAAILRPFLVARLREQAISALRDHLRDVLRPGAGGAGPHVRARGPRDLLDAFEAALAGTAVALDCEETTTVDLLVEIEGTRLETRLADWIAGLDDAPAKPPC